MATLTGRGPSGRWLVSSVAVLLIVATAGCGRAATEPGAGPAAQSGGATQALGTIASDQDAEKPSAADALGALRLPTWPPPPELIPGGVDPEDLLLRLSDLPPGYLIGDDSGCGPWYSTEGSSAEVEEFLYGRWPGVCIREFEQYTDSRPSDQPPLIESLVIIFGGGEDAELGLAAAGLLIPQLSQTGSADWREMQASDGSSLLRAQGAYVRTSDSTEAYAAVRRDENVVSIVIVAGVDGLAGEQAALDYLAKQHERLTTPTTARADELDDLEVPLDRPNLAVPVYWLGRTFEPGGDLPSLELVASWGPLKPGGGPGWNVELDYSSGVKIGIWERESWAAFKATDFGRAVWDAPCAELTLLAVDGGRAEIYGGHVGHIVEGLPVAPAIQARPVAPGSGPASPATTATSGGGPGLAGEPTSTGNATVSPTDPSSLADAFPLPDWYSEPDASNCPEDGPDRYLAHVYFDDAVVTVNIPFAWPDIKRSGAPDPYNCLEGMAAVARGLIRR